MQAKKQQLIFKGLGRDNKLFFTSSFEAAVMHSRVDPVAMNRKTKKAMPKMIKELSNDREQNDIKADTKKKKERKKNKTRRLSRRLNNK